MLYIVSTPIGNLEDMTFRAVKTLKESDLIAAEDTRHTPVLLKKYGIETPLTSFHSYSSDDKLEKIVEMLKDGKNISLVSDAGTPGISDPAYTLIRRAVDEGIKIIPIPGASSLLAAVVVSGMPMDKFLYLGFLPLKKGRQTLLNSLKEEQRTIVIFEAPHRILRTLEDLLKYLGDREIAVCRELTKMYEEILRVPISEAISHFKKKNPKGEFVLVVKGAR